MEATQEVGVKLSKGYNGDLTSRENRSVGGQMVKKMMHSNFIKSGGLFLFLYPTFFG